MLALYRTAREVYSVCQDLRQLYQMAAEYAAQRPSPCAREVELISDFRGHFGGEGNWLRAELKELDQFRRAFGKAAKWEDVRSDGSSDGHWEAENMVGP